MKKLLTLCAVLALTSACSYFPRTTAGWESGGFVGAAQGLSGALLDRCILADGTEVQVAVDDLEAGIGTDRLSEFREKRQDVCFKIGLTSALIGAAAPIVAPPAPDKPAS